MAQTAKKAVLKDARIKLLVWGKSGAGKSRFALSAPSPLVVDLEGSTRLYANEFDFYVAEVDKTNPATSSVLNLIVTILREINAGEYPDRQTLVIDPVTDLLESLETVCATEYEKQVGKQIHELNAVQKTKWYNFRRDKTRNMLNQLKDIPMNLVLVGRTKIVWGTGSDGKMVPVGETFDAHEIVEYLMDVGIKLEKHGDEIIGKISKGRSSSGKLPDIMNVPNFMTIKNTVQGIVTPQEQSKTAKKSEVEIIANTTTTPLQR